MIHVKKSENLQSTFVIRKMSYVFSNQTFTFHSLFFSESFTHYALKITPQGYKIDVENPVSCSSLSILGYPKVTYIQNRHAFKSQVKSQVTTFGSQVKSQIISSINQTFKKSLLVSVTKSAKL